MPLQECPGCGRSAADVGPAVARCGYLINRGPERCIWQAKQAPVAAPDPIPISAPVRVAPPVQAVPPPIPGPSPSPDPGLALQLETLRQELDTARADADRIRQRMEAEVVARAAEAAARSDETAARAAAEAHADQSRKTADAAVAQHGFLHDEVARLEARILSLLAVKPAPLPQPVGTPGEAVQVDPPVGATQRLTWLRGAVEWVVVSRMKLGSISAVVGALLGGSLGWFSHADTTTSTVVAKATDTQTTTHDLSTPRPVTSQDLQARVETALGRNRIGARLSIDSDLRVVGVDDGLKDAVQREATDAIIRDVYTGAGLPDPEIRRPPLPEAASVVAPTPATDPATNAVGQRDPTNKGRAARADAAAREARKSRPTEEAAAAPEPAPAQTPAARVPTVEVSAIRAVGIVDRCEQQTNKSPLSPLYTWSMSSCMKKECCRPGLVQSDECITYNNRFPLNCPRS